MKTKSILAILVGLSWASAAFSAEELLITIKDHRFTPAEINIQAGKKVKLIVDNQDPSAEEFESYALNREKVIAGKSKAAIFVGPLKPGRYPFFGEFHQDTAQGAVVAEAR